MTRIAVVGASYGTIAAALTLRKMLPAVEIVFINRTRTFLPRRLVTDILAARTMEHEHEIYLASLCEKNGIRFREDNLTRIDTAAQTLELGSGERLTAEYLLLDLPHEPHSADVPGAEYASSLSGLTSAHALRKHLIRELTLARDTNKAPHRTSIVVGAGIQGIEAIAALRALSLELCEKNYLFSYEVEHIIIDGHTVADPVPQYVKRRIASLLEERGVEWYDQKNIRFENDGVMLGDRELETNTIVWTATPKGNRLFADANLATDARSFLIVDEELKARPWLFAIGQSVRTAGKHALHERTGDALIMEGIAAAENITASVEKRALRAYAPRNDTTRIVAFDKRHGFGWFGPCSWTGALPVKLRAWRETRLARTAQNI